MSRELKVRIWDKEVERMFYCGDGISLADLLKDANTCDDEFWLLFTEHAVLQYTGLKDKKGREIYEGDILKFAHCDTSKPFLIAWNEQEARFTDYSPKEKAVVIGNIYENPELLEEGSNHE